MVDKHEEMYFREWFFVDLIGVSRFYVLVFYISTVYTFFKQVYHGQKQV